jgi:hypothetical protein
MRRSDSMKKYCVSGLTEEDSLQDGQNKYEEHRNCQARRSARKGPDIQGREKKKSQNEHAIARSSSSCYENPVGSSKVAWDLKELLLLLHI